MTAEPILAIIADDLTGASDTAVQFARRGWDARIALAPYAGPATPTGVPTAVAVSTDVRAAADVEAADKTARAVEGVSADRLYLKIDSTARGSIAGQIAGAVRAWSRRHPDAVAVVCPAYPAMERSVENGEVLVGGVPVHLTSIGTDPVTPVLQSSLLARVPTSWRALPSEIATAPAGSVLVLDARSSTELDLLARTIEAVGERVVAVGSAGLAESLARYLGGAVRARTLAPAEGPALVLVSSLNPISHAQVDALRDDPDGEAHVIDLTVADLECDEAVLSEGAAAIAPTGALVLRTALTRVAEGDRSAAQRAAAALAAITAAHVVSLQPASLGLVGGDGARAVLRALGADGLAVYDAVTEGVPLSTVVGGAHSGLVVWTKAGGFGDDRALVDILAHPSVRLRDPRPTEKGPCS